MNGFIVHRSSFIVLLFVAGSVQADFHEFQHLPVDPALDLALRRTADATLKAFPKLTADNLAMTLVDVTKPDVMSRADDHGDAPFYPASVVKLFFMVEVFHQHKENDPDVPRALHEMIAASDNDATAFLLDTISDTCSGPELQGRAVRKFIDRRRVVNSYLNPMGYDISAMAKPWSFGPFGRDMQLMGGPDRPNRNRATANSVASIVLWIYRRRAVSPTASDAMLALMQREIKMTGAEEDQVTSFIGEALTADVKLWSKAGWTSEVRHDAALVEFPGGRRMIIVIFTRGIADDKTLLPSITRTLLGELGLPAASPPAAPAH
jgi:beta-lactamase class A